MKKSIYNHIPALIAAAVGLLILCLALLAGGHSIQSQQRAFIAILIIAPFAALICLTGKGKHPVPSAPIICAAALLIQGAWMTFNAHSRYDPELRQFITAAPPFPTLPGAVDGTESMIQTRATAVMLLVFFVALVVCRDHHASTLLSVAIYGSSVLVATIGILDGIGVLHLARVTSPRLGGHAFSTFPYHASAGAFLNLAIPGLLLRAILPTKSSVLRLLAGAGSILLITAILLSQSRGSQIILFVETVAVALFAFLRRNDTQPSGPHVPHPRRWRPLFAVVLLLVLATSIVLSNARWQTLQGQFANKFPRFLLWRIAAHLVSSAGALGHGPGSYRLLYPHVPQELLHDLYSRHIVHVHRPGDPVTMWSQAHQDYLQDLVEWGWVGGTLWILLLGSSLLIAFRAIRNTNPGSPRFISTGAACIALLGVMTHSLFDFPLQVLAIQVGVAVLMAQAWTTRSS